MRVQRIVVAALLSITAIGIHAAPHRRAAASPPYVIQLGPNVSIRDVTASPEAIWFTSDKSGSEAVGRVDYLGRVELFPTPTVAPREIAAARDGSIWFSMVRSDGAHGLARVSSNGSYAPFWMPGVSISDIAAESSERVWYTDTSQGKVGSLTIHGQVFETDAGQESGRVFAQIALGSDGSVWMATNHKIIRLQEGQLREWEFEDVLGRDLRVLAAIAVASDGVAYAISRPERDIGVGTPRNPVLVRIDLDGTASTSTLDRYFWPHDLHIVGETLYVGAHLFGAFGFPFPQIVRIDRSRHVVTHLPLANLLPFPMYSRIAAVVVGPDGTTWIGYAGGSFLFRPFSW